MIQATTGSFIISSDFVPGIVVFHSSCVPFPSIRTFKLNFFTFFLEGKRKRRTSEKKSFIGTETLKSFTKSAEQHSNICGVHLPIAKAGSSSFSWIKFAPMITIRKSTATNVEFVSAHAYRLVEFGPPKWRDQQLMTQADIKHNIAAILSGNPDVETFIALDDAGEACGFICLTMQTDYYTQEPHAHITDIAVTKKAEGKGVGKLLLQKADEWARQKNVRWITLNVFEGNTHAQAIYEKAGYQKEWIKYLKQLD